MPSLSRLEEAAESFAQPTG